MTGDDAQTSAASAAVADGLRVRHPGLRESVLADARANALHRGESFPEGTTTRRLLGVLRLAWVSDAFLAQAAYRAKAAMQRRRVPVLPRFAHRLSMMLAGVSIGDPVLLAPGAYVVHGGVVIDGITEIGPGAVISPWVTIGLKAGCLQGPRIGSGVQIGTGAKIIGPIVIGDGAVIGANAVVVSDVAAGTKVAGVPAVRIGSA